MYEYEFDEQQEDVDLDKELHVVQTGLVLVFEGKDKTKREATVRDCELFVNVLLHNKWDGFACFKEIDEKLVVVEYITENAAERKCASVICNLILSLINMHKQLVGA